jgi:hypothetical protein
MEFKQLLKLYLVSGFSLVFAGLLIILGPFSCSIMNADVNGSTTMHVIGYILGLIGLLGGFALIAVAAAARHFLFKDVYKNPRHNTVNIIYRGKHRR